MSKFIITINQLTESQRITASVSVYEEIIKLFYEQLKKEGSIVFYSNGRPINECKNAEELTKFLESIKVLQR